MEVVFGIGLFVGIIMLIVHLCMLGTPYIEMRYSVGRPRYYVWIRQFLGYNDLAGSFDTEQEAKKVVERIRNNPPKVLS